MTFDEWYPYKSELVNGIGNNPINRYRHEAAQAAWHAGQEAMKERAARACEGYEVGEDTPPQPGDGPDGWDWHSKDYAETVRALEVI